jgi:poly-gamma-glutamate synthesis protein (capsule biosynthesis protein)
MRSLRFVCLFSALAFACSSEPGGASDGDDDGEPVSEGALTTVNDADETGRAASAIPLEGGDDFIDVRGVGDSAWTRSHVTPPPAAGFGAGLDAFDASKRSYRGDISFINFESVVGEGCSAFSKQYVPGQSYAFISRPENLAQAIARGFNLIGLANNHTRDCTRTTDGLDGVESTRRATRALASSSVAFHGVSEDANKRKPAIVQLSLRGRTVRVAFGAAYLGIGSGPGVTCKDDVEPLMTAMRDADVDLRILTMHSVDDRNQAELAQIGERFVKTYGGDVVFGEGPHVWKPVRVLRKPNGKSGVVFESVGNFLDPALAGQAKNYIARALFSRDALTLAQVQLVAVENRGEALVKSSADAASVPANLKWQKAGFDFPTVYAPVKE